MLQNLGVQRPLLRTLHSKVLYMESSRVDCPLPLPAAFRHGRHLPCHHHSLVLYPDLDGWVAPTGGEV